MALKIEGGSFGTSGAVAVDYDRGLISVNGAATEEYERSDVIGVEVDKSVQSKTSVLSVMIGLILFTPLLTYFLGIVGLGIGLILTYFGSKYTQKKYTAVIRFGDGKSVKISGSRTSLDRLTSLK